MINNPKRIILLFPFLITVFLIITNCSPVDVSGSEVTNENVISITGYVKDNTGKGVPNISATLTSLKFSDTTDGTGLYSIEISEDSLNVLGIRLKDISDTLIITQDENRLVAFSIDNFVDSLPDTYLIQRNISGKLETTAKGFSKVEAIISSSADTTVYTQELWLNEITNEFSSFIYMHSHNDDRIYSIYVTVYDSLDHLVGRSQTIKFPENAGDINMGSFNPFNILPTISINAVNSAEILDSVEFKVGTNDDYTSKIVEYCWYFEDGSITYGQEVSHSFSKSGVQTINLKCTDEYGNVFNNSHLITIHNYDTKISGSPFTRYTQTGTTLTFSVTAEDKHGIEKIIWNFGEGSSSRPQFDTTLGSTSSTVSHTYLSNEDLAPKGDQMFPLIITIVDSLGDAVSQTSYVRVHSTLLNNSRLKKVPANGESFIWRGGITSTISFDYDFWMDSIEVTESDFNLLMTQYYPTYFDPSKWLGGGLSGLPVNMGVSLTSKILYCNARSKAMGRDTVYSFSRLPVSFNGALPNLTADFTQNGFRLPTEIEWEFACRGGMNTDTYWGKNIDSSYLTTLEDSIEVAEYIRWPIHEILNGMLAFDTARAKLETGAQKKPNGYGLYDLLDNISEECHRWNHKPFSLSILLTPDKTQDLITTSYQNEYEGYFTFARSGGNYSYVSLLSNGKWNPEGLRSSMVDDVYYGDGYLGTGLRLMCHDLY